MQSQNTFIKLITHPEPESTAVYDGLSFIFFEIGVTVYGASMESTLLNTS